MSTFTITPAAYGSIEWFENCLERARHSVFSHFLEMTPELASHILLRNDDNRNIRIAKKTQYVADILAGRWAMNGEPIIISDDGQLNDGQHRCAAVVEANVSIVVLTVFGVSRETRTTVDQGANRGAGDYLSMTGIKNSNALAAVARMITAYRKTEGRALTGINLISNAQVMEIVSADPNIQKSVEFAVSHSFRAGVTDSVIAVAHYIASEADPAKASEYIASISSGQNLSIGDPAFMVREKLLTIGRASREIKLEVLLRGFLHFAQGRKMTRVMVVGSFPAMR